VTAADEHARCVDAAPSKLVRHVRTHWTQTVS